MTLPRLPLTRALAALVAEATGYPCGVGELPRIRDAGGRWSPAEVPYTILDALPGDFTGPPLFNWHADASWTYQVTSLGERGDQTQWLADRVRTGLVARSVEDWKWPLRVPGMRVIDRELGYDAGGETTVSAAGSIVSYVQRITVTVTPA